MNAPKLFDERGFDADRSGGLGRGFSNLAKRKIKRLGLDQPRSTCGAGLGVSESFVTEFGATGFGPVQIQVNFAKIKTIHRILPFVHFRRPVRRTVARHRPTAEIFLGCRGSRNFSINIDFARCKRERTVPTGHSRIWAAAS